MSSNLLKSGFVSYNTSEKRVIESHKRLEKIIGNTRNLEQRQQMVASDLIEPSEGDELDALFEEEFSQTVYRETADHVSVAPVMHFDGPTPDELIAQAMEEIEQMKAAAQEDIERIKAQAYDAAHHDGRNDGFDYGHAEAVKEIEALKKQLHDKERELEEVYQQKMESLEPLFVDALTDIYEHVIGAKVSTDREIVLHLLGNAIRNVDGGRNFFVRVAKEDYSIVNAHKQQLLERMPNATLEVIEDVTLKSGDCLLETDGGIFDCSVDVELKALNAKLRMLAYQKEGQ